MAAFNRSYIDKCIKYYDHINYLIERSRGLFNTGNQLLRLNYFQCGDFFHCPRKMNHHEIKEVKTIINQITISTGLPFKDYPASECIYIPTEEQLAEGLLACSLNMEPDAFGKGPEVLLDRYIEFLEQNKAK